MLHVDIPTRADLHALLTFRAPICVSLYQPTSPLPQEAEADRIELKNQAAEAVRQLEAAGADKRQVAALAEHLDDLVDDDEFWRFQAHSLAVLATPEQVRTFRVPNAFAPLVKVSDRFHLKPLLRTLAFPNACYVLGLSAGGVRLLEVSAGLPTVSVKVAGLPGDAASAIGKASIKGRSPSGRIQGSEGEKVRLRQFARQVDAALRPVLAGSDLPLILAAAPILEGIYRGINTYPHMALTVLSDSPETLSDAALGEQARGVLDALYATQLTDWRALYADRGNQGRATADIDQVARAATFGAVESALVDIDGVLSGTVDETTGAIAYTDAADLHGYGVVDAIASRVILAGGRVIGVRKADIPGGAAVAAILRYPV